MAINRDFFQGYADRIAVSDFSNALDDNSSSIVLEMLLKARVKSYVESGSLIVKEFELDLYRKENHGYVVHICRLDGSTNYCDYYMFEQLTGNIKYRIFRALLLEAMETSEISYETGVEASDIQDLIGLLQETLSLGSSIDERK